jgi:hypothetical protein
MDRLAHPGLADAVTVALRGVEVPDAGIERQVERLDAALFFAISRPKTVAAADRQNRDLRAGSAEDTSRQSLVVAGGAGSGSRADSSYELSPGQSTHGNLQAL